MTTPTPPTLKQQIGEYLDKAELTRSDESRAFEWMETLAKGPTLLRQALERIERLEGALNEISQSEEIIILGGLAMMNHMFEGVYPYREGSYSMSKHVAGIAREALHEKGPNK